MGRDKAWLPFGDERLLQRVVRLVGDAVDDVLVVARPGQELPALPEGVRVLRDDVPDQGPIGGLVPGLAAARGPAFATGCDVPFVSPAVVEALFAALDGHDVAVPESEGYLQPLCAVYRRSTAAVLRTLLAAGRLRPVFVFDEVATRRVSEDELRGLDPGLRCLRNVNSPDAYDAALADTFPEVHVDLFDLARRRADATSVSVRAHTVRGALLAAADRLPGLVPDVLDRDGVPATRWRVVLPNGDVAGEDVRHPLARGERIALITAQAGG